MVQKQLVWTPRSKQQLNVILSYYTNHNGSNLYSQQLHSIIQRKLQLCQSQPFMGKKINNEHVRALFIAHLHLFYQVSKQYLLILDIWDGRQNPESIKYYKKDL